MAQLKQLVDRPDVVEMHDVTAQDPKLLVHLKVGRGVCLDVFCVCVCACMHVCVMHMMTLLKIPSCSSTSKCGGGRGGWCVYRCIHVGGEHAGKWKVMLNNKIQNLLVHVWLS